VLRAPAGVAALGRLVIQEQLEKAARTNSTRQLLGINEWFERAKREGW